jgi:hypothetical protein
MSNWLRFRDVVPYSVPHQPRPSCHQVRHRLFRWPWNELNIKATLLPPYLDRRRQPSTDVAYSEQITILGEV